MARIWWHGVVNSIGCLLHQPATASSSSTKSHYYSGLCLSVPLSWERWLGLTLGVSAEYFKPLTASITSDWIVDITWPHSRQWRVRGKPSQWGWGRGYWEGFLIDEKEPCRNRHPSQLLCTLWCLDVCWHFYIKEVHTEGQAEPHEAEAGPSAWHSCTLLDLWDVTDHGC